MTVNFILVIIVVMVLILVLAGISEMNKNTQKDDDNNHHRASTPFFDKNAQNRSNANAARKQRLIDKDNVSEQEKNKLFSDLDDQEEAFWAKYDFDPDDFVKKKKK